MAVGVHSLGYATKCIQVAAAVAAGTTDVTSDGVDCANHEGVMFIADMGTLTATQVTNMYAQQSDDNGVADPYSDLEGSRTANLADGDINKLLILEIVKPRKRYVRVILDRGTANAVLDGIVAILHGGRTLKESEDSSVSDLKVVVSPAEGTP